MHPGIRRFGSAGLPIEAVNVLQDSGLWKYAATLAAHALRRDQQTAALERWATHIHMVTPFPRREIAHLIIPTPSEQTHFVGLQRTVTRF